MTTGKPSDVLIAIVGAPHGVHGEVRLKSYTGKPADFALYGPLTARGVGQSLSVARFRGLRDDLFVVKFVSVDSRIAAERLNGCELSLPRAALPATDEGEFYHADLIGLRAELHDGALVGRVANVLNFGAGDILEVAPASGGETMLIPFTRAFAPSVDVKGGRIVVIPPIEVEADLTQI